MKNKFAYCFEPRGDELEEIWKNGILTTDTNVLLDLYRYHQDTRDSIISNLEKFEGELWLSHRATMEFFKNRKKVIISSEKTFQDAIDETDNLNSKLDNIVGTLKGNRIIPNEIASELKASIENAIIKAKEDIKKAKDGYPKYLQNDPILEKISDLFNEKIGDEPENYEELINIAKDRIKNKIPPGYRDITKDDDGPCGDYVLWSQLIEHSKTVNKPLILITSERKEDWWEKIKGKTVGPRPELLKEAFEKSGNHILIYQTENFIKVASEKYGTPTDISVIKDIIAVSKQRTEPENAIEIIDHTIEKSSNSYNKGVIKVKLLKPVRNFTVSRSLNPRFIESPKVNVLLISSPDENEYRTNASTGTVYDFNIHIIAGYKKTLPIGTYIFQYVAELPKNDGLIDNSDSSHMEIYDEHHSYNEFCIVCEQKLQNCICAHCDNCEQPLHYCDCEYCDNCRQLLDYCVCEDCEVCGEKKVECLCSDKN
ncbi:MULTISPECIES: PIN-like domain-containing protein [Providencia]|uniref:PIN-like domain-containing protein n=1 Tax=Providencia TaxID=586 RepID=UPI002349EE32|nr:PIN-like domain-containing protein [Providencia sp. PROV254]